MSIKSRAELQGTFTTGAKPTQQNFADLTDSYQHVTDSLPVNAVLAAIAGAQTDDLHTSLGTASHVLTGRTIYVDTGSRYANDDHASSGIYTANVPFKTLQAAYAAALSGDTIIVMKGTYNESPVMDINGYNGNYPGNFTTILFDCIINGDLKTTSTNNFNMGKIIGIGKPMINGGISAMYSSLVEKIQNVTITQGVKGITITDAIQDCDITYPAATPPPIGIFSRSKITFATEWPIYSVTNTKFSHCDVFFSANINSGAGGVFAVDGAKVIFEYCNVSVNGHGFTSNRFNNIFMIFRHCTISFTDYLFLSEQVSKAERLVLHFCFTNCTNIDVNTGAAIFPSYQSGFTILEVIRSTSTCKSGVGPSSYGDTLATVNNNTIKYTTF